jgi:hypothetical protein
MQYFIIIPSTVVLKKKVFQKKKWTVFSVSAVRNNRGIQEYTKRRFNQKTQMDF